MSEFSQSTGQADPTHHNPRAEITEQQIENASAADIFIVAKAEYDRLDELQFHNDIVASEVQAAGVLKKLENMNQIVGVVESYAIQGGGENFTEYLKERMRRADEAGAYDVLEVFIKAGDWFDSSAAQNLLGDVLHGQQESKDTEPYFSSQSKADTTLDRHVEDTQNEEEAARARQSIEDIKVVELFNTVVKLGKDKTQLNTGFVGGFQAIGDGSRSDSSQVFIPAGFKEVYKRENRPADWREGLNEVVMFSDLVEQDTRKVVIQQAAKGRFGRTHTNEYTKTETVPGSERPVTIHNELTGQDEPTVRFRYSFDVMKDKIDDPGLPQYREFTTNRGGQNLAASVDLPKSIANQLQAQVRSNPQSARTLVERLFLENNDGRLTEEHWRLGSSTLHNQIRPPYEELPADWGVAIVTNQEGDGAGGDYSVERVQV